MRARLFGIVILLASLTAPYLAHAECPEAHKARTAYERGERALASQDVERALRSFTEANELCPNPQTRLAIANAYLLGKKATSAATALEQYITEAAGGVDWCVVLELRRQIAAVASSTMHRVDVQVRPQSARLYLRENTGTPADPMAPGCLIAKEGDRVTLDLPNGRYAVTGQLENHEPMTILLDPSNTPTLEVTLPEHEVARATVSPPPAPAVSRIDVATSTPPHWYHRPENWIWIGSGLIGVASVTTGIWALSLQSDLDRDCPQRKCADDAAWSRVDKHDRLATLSTVGFVAAGIGALTGAGMHLVLRRPEEPAKQATIGATVGPGRVSLSWRF
jgi:hypothetical protein